MTVLAKLSPEDFAGVQKAEAGANCTFRVLDAEGTIDVPGEVNLYFRYGNTSGETFTDLDVRQEYRDIIQPIMRPFAVHCAALFGVEELRISARLRHAHPADEAFDAIWSSSMGPRKGINHILAVAVPDNVEARTSVMVEQHGWLPPITDVLSLQRIRNYEGDPSNWIEVPNSTDYTGHASPGTILIDDQANGFRFVDLDPVPDQPRMAVVMRLFHHAKQDALKAA